MFYYLLPQPHSLLQPCAINPTPYTLLQHCALHPTPYNLHLVPHTVPPTRSVCPTPYSLHTTPYTLLPPPYSRHFPSCTLLPSSSLSITPLSLLPTPFSLLPTLLLCPTNYSLETAMLIMDKHHKYHKHRHNITIISPVWACPKSHTLCKIHTAILFSSSCLLLLWPHPWLHPGKVCVTHRCSGV